GLIALLHIQGVFAADLEADPLLTPLLAEAERHAPRMPGDTIGIMRFIMGNDTYRNPSTPFSISVMGASAVYTHPSLILTSMVVPDPDYWEELFRYVDHFRVPGI